MRVEIFSSLTISPPSSLPMCKCVYYSDADQKRKPPKMQGWSPFYVQPWCRTVWFRMQKRFRQWHRIQHICRSILLYTPHYYTHTIYRVNATNERELVIQSFEYVAFVHSLEIEYCLKISKCRTQRKIRQRCTALKYLMKHRCTVFYAVGERVLLCRLHKSICCSDFYFI